MLHLHKRHDWVGCLGCLDGRKWEGKNCAAVWFRHFEKWKGKYPSIGLEVVVDCHLWFWFAFFDIHGTQNDVNIFGPLSFSLGL
jgi:hypothetical protein